MSASDSHRPAKPTRRIRTDGWTAARQLRFLAALTHTRSVTQASRAAGMSRESAYRLRERCEGVLFAALWEEALAFQPAESHNRSWTNGQLMRLLGNHFRRKRGDFSAIGSKRANG
jgi:hypothetical protein